MAEKKRTPDGRRLKELLKEATEAAAPNLRKTTAAPRRAKVTAVKPAGGTYVCSVQAVLNDGRPDPNAPVIPDVEIPLMWAGPNRGMVCPPTVGEYCDIGFYDGDANSPYITNFRPNGQAPAAELDSLMIQHSPGIRIGFKPDGTFIVEAPRVEVTATEYVEVKGGARITLKAPLIELIGRVEVTGGIYQRAGDGGSGMEIDGQVDIVRGGLHSQRDVTTNSNVAADGSMAAAGDVSAGGRVDDAGGNTNHHGH